MAIPMLEVCPSCLVSAPVEEFYPPGARWDRANPDAIVCQACREQPPLPAAPEWLNIPAKLRKAMELAADGMTWDEARVAAGIPKSFGLEDELAKNGLVRRVYQALLRDRRLDLNYMAAKLRLMLSAQRAVFNKATGEFEHFPDNAIQMRALELLHKQHSLLGDAGGDDNPRPTVVFVTPIGDGKSPKSQLLPQGVGGYVIEGRSRVLDDGEVVHAADE